MQENKNESTNQAITVALLMEDIRDAKEASAIFRRAGVLPHLYESLQDFWMGTIDRVPTLCMIDVRLMSSGELTIKNHPHLKNGDMPLAFFYSDASAPLIYSAFDVPNLGIIRREVPMQGQIKGVLERYNRLAAFETRAREAELKLKAREAQMDRVVASTTKLKEKEHYTSLLKSVIGRFELQREQDDFFQAAEVVFGTVQEVSEFACLELSFNGQKLVSPKLFHSKFREVPSLWLGQTCPQGIEFFAQNLASQVCLDLMGGDLMALAVKGKKRHPDRLIFLKVNDQELLEHFDWESLERYLSGLNSYFDSKNDAHFENDKNALNSWELFGLLDQVMFGRLPDPDDLVKHHVDELALIDLDFTDLVTAAREKRSMRFAWRKFYQDFFTRFEASKKHTFKIACTAPNHVVMIVDAAKADMIFHDIKQYSLRFPLWRYFEDPDAILGRNMKPEIKMVPLATEAYIRHIEGRNLTVAATSVVEQKPVAKAKSAVWIKGPEQTM
jgi:hypothetical protein